MPEVKPKNNPANGSERFSSVLSGFCRQFGEEKCNDQGVPKKLQGKKQECERTSDG
jgi:hypothetical protein